MEATPTLQNGASHDPTGLGQFTATLPFTPPPPTVPAPAVTADTTPPVLGVEIPLPPGVMPAQGSTDALAPPGTAAIVPAQQQQYVLPTYSVQAPVAAPVQNTIPTWAWVVGGAALLGLLGFIAWTMMNSGAPVVGASKSNPLPRHGRGRRRLRRARRARRVR